jgi:hypothetical protein
MIAIPIWVEDDATLLQEGSRHSGAGARVLVTDHATPTFMGKLAA